MSLSTPIIEESNEQEIIEALTPNSTAIIEILASNWNPENPDKVNGSLPGLASVAHIPCSSFQSVMMTHKANSQDDFHWYMYTNIIAFHARYASSCISWPSKHKLTEFQMSEQFLKFIYIVIRCMLSQFFEFTSSKEDRRWSFSHH